MDRADAIRNDPDRLGQMMASLSARLVLLDGIDPVLDAEGRLTWVSLAEAAPGAALLFIGLIDGKPRFAPLNPGLTDGTLRSAAMFRVLDRMPAEEAATYAVIRSLIDWHVRNGFCARCATPSDVFRGGWGRRCHGCGSEHFPRVDPVVIILAEHDGRVLLGRQPHYPPERYSALAGFVEPGETIEEAVARELAEEAGVRVRTVRYVMSQPWPFPSSLMMACVADVEDDRLIIDTTELEDAFWASRAEVAAALCGAPDARFRAPPPYAIAHTLLHWWLDQPSAMAA